MKGPRLAVETLGFRETESAAGAKFLGGPGSVVDPPSQLDLDAGSFSARRNSMRHDSLPSLDSSTVLDRTQDSSSSGLFGALSALGPTALVGQAWNRLKDWIKSPFYFFYLRRLRGKTEDWARPNHLGVIMDGNRRYARESGFVRAIAGHHHGAEKLHEVLRWCHRYDIPVVTVWCFSIENFQRSTEEVEDLLGLFEDKTREMAESHQVHEHQIRVRFIGRLEMLPESLRREIARVEEATADYDRLQLNIAMAYGGREEIADAVRHHLRERAAAGESLDTMLDTLDTGAITRHLYTSGQPEPDLILRTSGELRLSGFLLWQSAYSEYYFCDTNWPAFREIDFLRALRAYDVRHRRFGR